MWYMNYIRTFLILEVVKKTRTTKKIIKTTEEITKIGMYIILVIFIF